MGRHSRRHTSILADFSTSTTGTLIYGIFAYLIPAYKTFESFQTPDQVLWLKYWLVMIFILKAEELIRSLFNLPVQWYYLKLGLLSYFLLANTEFIGELYNNYEKPYFEKYSTIIYNLLRTGYRTAIRAKDDVQKKIIDIAAANEAAVVTM